MILTYQEALEAAKKDFESAIALNPSFPQVYVELGELCLKLGLPQEAEKAYDEGSDRFAAFDMNQVLLVKRWCHLEEKWQLKPTPNLGNEIGELYLERHTFPAYQKARFYFEQALIADSSFLKAQKNLKFVLTKIQYIIINTRPI